MSEMQRVNIIVHGRVQGVFYRDSTVRKARELGLFGTVRNLPDGTYSVRAQVIGYTDDEVDRVIVAARPLYRIALLRPVYDISGRYRQRVAVVVADCSWPMAA